MPKLASLLLVLVLGSTGLLGVPSAKAESPPWPWTTWAKNADHVHERVTEGDNVASDPSVIADPAAGGYRMVYSGASRFHDRISILEATSPDGVTWADVADNDGVVVEGVLGEWDAFHETSELLKVDMCTPSSNPRSHRPCRAAGSEYLLFYSGYATELDDGDAIPPADLGLATSTDGVHFTRIAAPVMTRTPGGADEQAIYSPSIVESGGTLYMTYTGWKENGGELLGATSTDYGRTWTKTPDIILDALEWYPGDESNENQPYAWMNNSTDEADLVVGPDGAWYLFFTAGSLDPQYVRGSIGMARSFTSPHGPWEIYPEPIMTPTEDWEAVELGFPSVLPEAASARMWYTGVGVGDLNVDNPFLTVGYRIGYAAGS